MFARLAEIVTKLINKLGTRFPKTSKITESQSDETVVRLDMNKALPQHVRDTITEVARVVVPALAELDVEYITRGDATVGDDDKVTKVILTNEFEALSATIDPLTYAVTLTWLATPEDTVDVQIADGSFDDASKQKIKEFLNPNNPPIHQS